MFTRDVKTKNMGKNSKQLKYTIFVAMFIAIISSSHAYAGKFPMLKKVDSPDVCMITNKFMGAKQIAVPIGKKVYYGCCEMCVGTLNKDVKSRYAIEPLTGKRVDKATAVIGAKKDGVVLYFENQNNFDTYLKKSKP
jgi:YHS domain-containing protein